MTQQARHGPSVAIWGTFDVANFGDHLFPRLFESEMRRRLPTADVRAFSPRGYLHPGPFDGGTLVEPLGKWSPERLRELAAAVDMVAIGGGEIIHTQDDSYAHYYGISVDEARELRPSEFFIHGLGMELEDAHPVVWHSVGIPFDFDGTTAKRICSAVEKRTYVTVRDEVSRDRLVRLGVEREISVVPDSAFLVCRVFTSQVLEKRLAHLRRIGAYPERERPIVVQGSRTLVPYAGVVGRALAQELDGMDVPIVLLEAGPCHGDGEFADAVEPFLTGARHRIAAGATVEDVVAAIAQSRGFIGISLHGNIVATVNRLPSAILNLAGYSKLDGFARLTRRDGSLVRRESEIGDAIRQVIAGNGNATDLTAIVAKIDEHFDRLAAIAERSVENRMPAPAFEGKEQSLRRAFEARGRRLVAERQAARDVIAGIREEALETIAQTRGEAAQRLAAKETELSAARAEVRRLLNLRSFRYTAPLRAIYARVRRRGR